MNLNKAKMKTAKLGLVLRSDGQWLHGRKPNKQNIFGYVRILEEDGGVLRLCKK